MEGRSRQPLDRDTTMLNDVHNTRKFISVVLWNVLLITYSFSKKYAIKLIKRIKNVKYNLCRLF